MFLTPTKSTTSAPNPPGQPGSPVHANRAANLQLDLPAVAQADAPPASPGEKIRHLAAAQAFRDWLEKSHDSIPSDDLNQGRALLESRRTSLAWLMEHDPAAALSAALTYAERARVPAAWSGLLEERFSIVADLIVLPDCSAGASDHPAAIQVEIPGRPRLAGRTVGSTTGLTSKRGVPVEGIALDGRTALWENAVQPLAGAEREAVLAAFPVVAAAADLPADAPAALIAGKVHRFASTGAREAVRELYGKIMALPGPDSAAPLTAALDETNPLNPDHILQGATIQSSTWTETVKKILVLNCVFPDRTAPVGTTAEWQTVMGEVSTWLSGVSYGKTSLNTTVLPATLTLPGTSASYEPTENYSKINTDARALAVAAGYDPAQYDITVVAFPYLNWPWSGRASLGGGLHWLNGNRSAKVIAHELGHNYGLWHANSWDVNDGSIMPARGAPDDNDPRHVEYGDRFSTMGAHFDDYPNGEFSPQAKSQLNWIPATHVQTVTAPGTYRIHRFDSASALNHSKLALKLQRYASETFWFGYRRRFTTNTFLNNGAYVTWEYKPAFCRLIDLTPDSQTSSHFNDKSDAALAVGRTFTDPAGYFQITPTAIGGTAPDEWMDLSVQFITDGNRPPVVALQLPGRPRRLNVPLTFTANATDPDGNALTYFWDAGGGRTATTPTASFTFPTAGSYSVSVRVEDGEGGSTLTTRNFNVYDLPPPTIQLPAAPWNARTPLTFTQNVSDPESPPLTYRWETSNGITGTGPAFSPSFLTGGSRTITLRAEDPDGSATVLSETLTIREPLTETTEIAVGSLTPADGALLHGLHVSHGSSLAAHSPDGSSWRASGAVSNGECRGMASGAGKVVVVGTRYDSAAAIWKAYTASSTDSIRWDIQSQSTTSASLWAVAFRQGLFVAVGDNGMILSSPDGVNWTSRSIAGFTTRLTDLTVTAHSFEAAASNGAILTSPDGLSWQARTLPAGPSSLSAIASDGTQIIASGYDFQYRRSTDGGATWQNLQLGLGTWFASLLTYGEGVWVAGSRDGTVLRLAISTDGQQWEAAPALTLSPVIRRIRIHDGRLWIYGVAGKIVHSALLPQGNQPPALTPNWPASLTARTPASFAALLSDPNHDPTGLLWEMPGLTWKFNSPATLTPLLGGRSQTITAWGSDGRGAHVSESRTYQVADPLLTWNSIFPASLTGTGLVSAASSPERTVLAGNTFSAEAVPGLSMDSMAWRKRAFGSNFYASGVAWRSPGFAVVGQDYEFSSNTWRFARVFSADGLTWSTPQILAGGSIPRAVTACPDAYVSVGDGGSIYRSTDGLTWSPIPSGVTSSLRGVGFVGAHGLAAGGGQILRSTDSGLSWTSITSQAGTSVNSSLVASAGGYLFLDGGYGRLRRYTPGTGLWQDTTITTNGVPFGLPLSVIYHNNTWIALSIHYQTGGNRRNLAVSLDGLTWECTDMNWASDPSALFTSGGNLFATGTGLLLVNGGAGDLDNDGITNLLEYAFATDASNISSGSAPLQYQGSLAGNGTLTQSGQPITLAEPQTAGVDFRAVFVRRKDYVNARLTYTPQFSSNLTTWQDSPAVPAVLSDDGVRQVVSVPYTRFIAGRKARFFRIKVDLLP